MIDILYASAATVAVAAGAGQVRHLIRAGRSEELSIATWALWFCTQSVSLVYTVSIHQPLLIVFNSLWVAMYGTMVALIVYYRKYPRLEVELQLQLAEESS